MEAHTLQLEGSVTNRLGGTPVPAVLIEAWDAEQKFPEVLSNAISDKAGRFKLSLEPALLEKAFAGRPQQVSLKLTYKGLRLAFSPSEDIVVAECKKPLALTVKVAEPYGGDNLFQQLPEDLRTELEGMKKHTETVLGKLKDEKVKQAFLENPTQALAAMGVPISPQLRQRLASQNLPKNLLTPRSYRLINGQIITPKIKINFTSGKGASHGR